MAPVDKRVLYPAGIRSVPDDIFRGLITYGSSLTYAHLVASFSLIGPSIDSYFESSYLANYARLKARYLVPDDNLNGTSPSDKNIASHVKATFAVNPLEIKRFISYASELRQDLPNDTQLPDFAKYLK